MNRFVRQPSLLIIMAACPCGVQGQVGERKLDAVPLFSGDAAHWTVSVPPGFPPESRMTALAGGQEGWVIGTGIVPGQVGPSFTNLPTGFLTGNGAMGGYFVAVGDGGEIAISTNDINWATVRSGGGPFVDNGLNEIIEFKGHAYAVGEGGLIVSSPVNNLSNWTVVAGRSKQRRFEIGTFEQGLNHDGTDFIAVSNNQYDFALFSSPDGETPPQMA